MTKLALQIEKISELINEIGASKKYSDKIFNLINISEYSRVFTNEIINALMVAKELINGEINIVLVAPMQSGKSGTINQLCNLILKDIGFIKPTEGVIFVNSMTDRSLFIQNMINLSNDRSIIKVMKMKDFKNHGFVFAKKNNIKLIVRDEDQYGCGLESSFNTGFFEKVRVEDSEKPLVTVSATPFDVMDAMEKNCVKGKIISGVTGEGYIGIKEMLELGLVRDLPGDYSHIIPTEDGKNRISNEIQECIFHLKKFKSSMGIIRTNKTDEAFYLRDQLKSLKKTNNFKVLVIGSKKECDYSISDGLDMIKEISNFQEKNTIIIIIGALSAGKNLMSLKENVKFVIETRRRQLANVVQGLPGRLCGYHKNKDVLIYAKKSILEKYVAFQKKPEIFYSMEFKNSLKKDEKLPRLSTQVGLKDHTMEGDFAPIKEIREYSIDSLYDKRTEEELSFLSEKSYSKILSFFNLNFYSSNEKRKGVRLLNNDNVNVRLASNHNKGNRVFKNWNKKIGDSFNDIFPNKQKNNKYGILINNFPFNHPENKVSFCGIKVFTSGDIIHRTYESKTKNTSMYMKESDNNLNL